MLKCIKVVVKHNDLKTRVGFAHGLYDTIRSGHNGSNHQQFQDSKIILTGYSARLEFLRRRQRSEQYRTSSQQPSHFLRQVNGKLHTGQILVGRSDLAR
jgi:hypothetical protein